MKKYLRNNDVESVNMAEELGVLNIVTGQYHVIDKVGNDIWRIMENPVTLDDIVVQLLKEYDIDEATCKNDVELFLQLLDERQLVIEV